MTISELIASLEAVKSEFGDIEVDAWDSDGRCDRGCNVVAQIELDDDLRRGSGLPFIKRDPKCPDETPPTVFLDA